MKKVSYFVKFVLFHTFVRYLILFFHIFFLENMS